VLPAAAAAELAALPEVQWIEHHETPRILNDVARAADRLNVAAVQSGHGLDGTGQIVAIADTGLDTGDTNTLSPDFAGRLLHVFDTGRLTNWSDTYYHGTHVAGSLLGTGAASGGRYRGAAPGAQLVFQSIMNSAQGLNLPDDLNDFYRPPYDRGARIHSDSWGSAVAGQYTADAMTTDEFIWDHPDQFVAYAAGNDGIDGDYDGVVDLRSLDAPASAKNVLAVGASESGRPPGGGGMAARTYGSAWRYDYPVPPIYNDLISSSPGAARKAWRPSRPAVPRRRPHQARRRAPGTDVVSVRSRASSAVGWGVVGENTNYCFMGGTSMATPLAAGCAALVRQHLVADRGFSQPSAALIKAALAGARARLRRANPARTNSAKSPNSPAPIRSRAGARSTWPERSSRRTAGRPR
jgi:subtilisin family serine protease